MDDIDDFYTPPPFDPEDPPLCVVCRRAPVVEELEDVCQACDDAEMAESEAEEAQAARGAHEHPPCPVCRAPRDRDTAGIQPCQACAQKAWSAAHWAKKDTARAAEQAHQERQFRLRGSRAPRRVRQNKGEAPSIGRVVDDAIDDPSRRDVVWAEEQLEGGGERQGGPPDKLLYAIAFAPKAIATMRRHRGVIYVRPDNLVAWGEYFLHPNGRDLLQDLERSGLRAHEVPLGEMIRLHRVHDPGQWPYTDTIPSWRHNPRRVR